MHLELPLSSPSWLFSANDLSISLTFKRKERLYSRNSLSFLLSSRLSVLTLFAPSLLMTPKWCSVCSPVLIHLLAYLSHSLWSLLASRSISHSLSPILPHLLLFTTSYSIVKWYEERQDSWAHHVLSYFCTSGQTAAFNENHPTIYLINFC